MPTRSLTAASVARIKPPKVGQSDYFDKGYPGLALRVSYGGAKAWVYFYRLHGKLRRLSLGQFPGMDLTEARDPSGLHVWQSVRARARPTYDRRQPIASQPLPRNGCNGTR